MKTVLSKDTPVGAKFIDKRYGVSPVETIVRHIENVGVDTERGICNYGTPIDLLEPEMPEWVEIHEDVEVGTILFVCNRCNVRVSVVKSQLEEWISHHSKCEPEGNTPTVETDLLPCPFCGTMPINHGYRIDCENCGSGLSVVDTFHDDKAAAHRRLRVKWNTRSVPVSQGEKETQCLSMDCPNMAKGDEVYCDSCLAIIYAPVAKPSIGSKKLSEISYREHLIAEIAGGWAVSDIGLDLGDGAPVIEFADAIIARLDSENGGGK